MANGMDFGSFKFLERLAGQDVVPQASGGGLGSILSGVGNFGTQALDFLGQNKDTIGLLGGLASNYMNFQTANNAQDLAQRQLALSEAERQRQIEKEEEQRANMLAGFQSSGLGSTLAGV